MSSRASSAGAQDAKGTGTKQQQHFKAKHSSEFNMEDSDYDSDDHEQMVDSNSLEDGRLLRPLHIETRSFPQLSPRPPSNTDWLNQYGWISLNVAAWFAATALAARAMQAWSHHVLQEWNHNDTEVMEWMDRVALATTVTAVQLLLGGLLGQVALQLFQWYTASSSFNTPIVSAPPSGLSSASSSTGWEQPKRQSKSSPQSPSPPLTPWISLPGGGDAYSLGPVQVLGVLHALGSLGANYGYMVGDDGAHTPVVQMIRLCEPFETMIWTQAFLPLSDEAHILSGSLLSAVMLTSGGAISLLDRKSPATAETVLTHPLAFALASGLCHSSRIVLQRLHNQTLNNNANNSNVASNNSKHASPSQVSSPTGSLLSSLFFVQKTPPTRKLERILWQFRQLSFESGKWTVAAAVGVHLYKLFHHQSWSLEHLGAVVSWRSVPLWTWHPLFNLCSMMTLGYCAALTHSILTVCRRTVTVLWEGTITDDLAGGVLVLLGAAWYLRLVVMQQQQSSRSTMTMWGNWLRVIQPMAVLLVLQVVYSTRTYTFHDHASFGEGGI